MNDTYKKMNIVTVVGTRPEIIRLSRVIAKLDNFFNHKLVHTGQNYDYELNKIFFKDLNIRNPDFYLESAGVTASTTAANVISSFDNLISKIDIDAVLILGDTNSCLAAYSAKRNKIPIFHMEAGNRCFDQRAPEEINRKIIDHISDINLPYSDISREYLLREGINPITIIKTGSPMFEVLEYYKDKIFSCNVLDKLNIVKEKYFLISAHREENIDNVENFQKFVKLTNYLASEYQIDIIVSTHPRTRKKIEESNTEFHSLVRIMKPLGFFDYNNLQINAKVVLSDSGTITEESSILNFPAINIRESHERPEGMEEGSVIMAGLEIQTITQAIKILESQSRNENRLMNIPKDYKVTNVSEKILRIINSYTDYVNRSVWKKNK